MKKIIVICTILFVLILSLLILNGNIGYFDKSEMTELYWRGNYQIPFPSICKCSGIKFNKHCLGASFDCQKIN